MKAIKTSIVFIFLSVAGQAYAAGIPVFDTSVKYNTWTLLLISLAAVVTVVALAIMACKPILYTSINAWKEFKSRKAK